MAKTRLYADRFRPAKSDDHIFVDSEEMIGCMLMKAGMCVTSRRRSVGLMADPDNERTYAVEPIEVTIEHGVGEQLGVKYVGVDAGDLPGMPSLCGRFGWNDGQDEDVSVAIVLRVTPGGPVARFNEQHFGVLTVGTAILQLKRLSDTSTSLLVGRWGWTVVAQKSVAQKQSGVRDVCHPGVEIRGHGSVARIERIEKRGSLSKWNRMNHMSSLKRGDCLVAVNGVPVSSWVEEGGTARLNEYLAGSGDRQEWVVVRVPGASATRAAGYEAIAAMIEAGIGLSDESELSRESATSSDCEDYFAMIQRSDDSTSSYVSCAMPSDCEEDFTMLRSTSSASSHTTRGDMFIDDSTPSTADSDEFAMRTQRKF